MQRNTTALIDSISDLEAAIVGVHDSRRAAKDKTAAVEYFAGLSKTLDLAAQVQRDADFNIMSTDLSLLIQTSNKS